MKKIGLKDWEVYNEPRVAVYFVCKQPACSNFASRALCMRSVCVIHQLRNFDLKPPFKFSGESRCLKPDLPSPWTQRVAVFKIRFRIPRIRRSENSSSSSSMRRSGSSKPWTSCCLAAQSSSSSSTTRRTSSESALGLALHTHCRSERVRAQLTQCGLRGQVLVLSRPRGPQGGRSCPSSCHASLL